MGWPYERIYGQAGYLPRAIYLHVHADNLTIPKKFQHSNCSSLSREKLVGVFHYWKGDVKVTQTSAELREFHAKRIL